MPCLQITLTRLGVLVMNLFLYFKSGKSLIETGTGYKSYGQSSVFMVLVDFITYKLGDTTNIGRCTCVWLHDQPSKLKPWYLIVYMFMMNDCV